MENQPLLGSPNHDSGTGKDDRTNLLSLRRQQTEVPYREVFEESDPGLLAECLQIFRRRKRVLIRIVFLGFLTSLLVTLLQTPTYQARGSIEIQNFNDNFLNLRNVSPTADDTGSSPPEYDVETQAGILKSESLLERVVAKLDLEKKLLPEQQKGLLSAWLKGLRGKQASNREKILTLVTKNLKISPEPNTRLIKISYDSKDPHIAADFVNTLTAEFVEQNLESHWNTTQQTGEWLTHQMQDVRIKLEKSEDKLQTYAKQSGLLFTSEKDNVAEEKLRQLQEELSKAQVDRVARQSTYELASSASPDTLPEVLDDATLKDYQSKLTDLRRQLADLSSSLTLSHPSVKKVEAQIAALELARDNERTDIIERIRNEFESAQRREHLLAANYASQTRLMSEQAAKVTDYNILKREVDTNRQLYDSMLQNVQEASMTSALRASNIRVVDSADPPTLPYKPNAVLNSVLGLLAGTLFGIVFAVAQERADRTIHGPGDTTIYLDVPELGAIPSVQAGTSKLFGYRHNGKQLENKKARSGGPWPVELITSNKTFSPLADAFRATLTSILYSGENGNRPRIIVITSANPGDGKTTVACNLALALAEIGPSVLTQSVLLIDGDLRRPRLHEIFGVYNKWGLTDLLEGKTPPGGSEGMAKTRFRNLFLLPSGSPPSNISGLLHSPRAVGFFNRVREEFHTVIIDAPPMLNLPDARVLGRLADGVVLVVRSADTRWYAAAAAERRLTEDGTRVLGTILNQWDPTKTNYYAYAHGGRYR